MASPQEEEENPEQADSGYESANRWLLERTRGKPQFDLLFTENMNYGYRRNLLGLKPVALAIDAVALVLIFGMAVTSWTGQLATTIQALSPEWWVSLIVALGHMLVFALYIQPDWVRTAAETYAHQLLSACDSLNQPLET